MFKLKLFVLFTLVCLLSALGVKGQQINEAELTALKRDLERRSAGLVSDVFNRRMERISRELSRDNFDRAIELLESLRESSQGNAYEHAMAMQNLGFAYVQAEQISKGLETLKQTLDLNALPYGPTMSTLFAYAQLLLAEGRHQDSLYQFRRWFFLTNRVTPDAYILKGAVYSELQNFPKAIELVEKGLAMTDEPREPWIAFAAGLYFQADRFQESANMFKQLAGIRPNEKRYWMQLAGILASMNNEAEGLSAMVMIDKIGQLNEETDFFNLCGLYNYNEIPINCARIIEKAMENNLIEDQERAHNILSRSYIMAREPDKALPSLEKLAAMSGATGEHQMRIGQIHYQSHRWKEAISAFAKALDQGGIDEFQRGNILLSKGIAQFETGEFAKAFETFSTLEQIESHKNHASAWINQAKQQLQ